MSVLNIKAVNEYDKQISLNNITVALFSAEWAEQCTQILDIMNEISGKSDYNNLKFINIPAEDLPEISIKHQIEAVPTVIFFQNSKAIDRIDGVDIAALTTKCKNLAGAKSEPATKECLEERLKALINKSKVMIFMKGDRDAPKCGFSKQIIQIINNTGVTYETFDILTDESVRQGLKQYSDWPTYPQVYVNGVLIGGLDIIKELVAGGELISTLQE